MNNLTAIILVSFSAINILYLGSELFSIRDEKVPKQQFGECKSPEQELPECQKVNNYQGVKNEKIVRKTKTSTKSKILGNGDLVEQTTVTEVIETIIHNPKDDISDQVVCEEESRSQDTSSSKIVQEIKAMEAAGYRLIQIGDCPDGQSSSSEKNENENKYDTPVVAFGNKDSDNLFKNIDDEQIDEKKEKFDLPVDKENHFQQFIPNSTSATEKETQLKDDSKENKTYEDLPPLHVQLSSGLHCCLSRLVTSAMRSWTFFLSGLIREVPLYCTDRCLYTRDNDSTSYCFTTNQEPSCTTNITNLMRLDPHNYKVELDELKTEEEIIADSKTAPVIKLNGDKKSEAPAPCCPVKQVTGEGEAAGLFVLRGKTPDRKSHCSDNCIYVKVGDVKQMKYCFGLGDLPTACHQKVPSISTLLHTNTTGREKPFRLEAEKVTSKLIMKSKDYESFEKNSDLKDRKPTHNMNIKEGRKDSKGAQQIKENETSKDTTSTLGIKENKQEGQSKLKPKKDCKGKVTIQNVREKQINPEIKDNSKLQKGKDKAATSSPKEIKQESRSDCKNKKENKGVETTQDIKEEENILEAKSKIEHKTEDGGEEPWLKEMKDIKQECNRNGISGVLVQIGIGSDLEHKKDEKTEEKQLKLDGKPKKEESDDPIKYKKGDKSDKTKQKIKIIDKQKDVTNNSEDEIPVVIEKNVTVNDESNVFVHNGIQIKKMPKKEIQSNSSVASNFQNETMSFNQSKKEMNKSVSLNKNDMNDQHDDSTSHLSRVDQEERTVFVVSEKCSAGYPMKIRKVLIQIEKNESVSVVNENNTLLERPLKIDQEIKLPVKIKKTPENGYKSGIADAHSSEKPHSSITWDSNSTNVHLKNTSNKSCLASHPGLNSSSENNKTIPSGEQSSALVNKSKSDVPNNNTEVKADKKNICKNINDMDAGEGTRTLPYRITLTERPKLINRDKDDTVKAEIPIQISCGTGKPYKLKPVQKNDGEPVQLEVDFPTKGFIPVRFIRTDLL